MAYFNAYALGFKVNGNAIPDPTSWSGSISDLDTLGERDQTGLLHRNRVATKQPLKLNYTNIPWDEAQRIVSLTSGESFQFTFMSLKTNALVTIRAYRGADLNYTVNTCFGGQFHSQAGSREECLVTIDLSIIEY